MNKRALTLLTMALAPICAFAIDGVTLINQSTVMAAGGFPYVISQPGSYKLSGNLIVPFGLNGIVVSAANVNIDLNGFNISSLGSTLLQFTDAITEKVAVSNIQIRNGSIAGFSTGVNFPTSTRVHIEDLMVDALVPGVVLGNGVYTGPNSLVRHVITNGNVQVTCPTTVVETLEEQLAHDEANGSCVLWLNRNSVDANPVRM